MDGELQALVETGKLSVKSAAVLDQLRPQAFCLHKSWGFGQVNSWNLLLNQIVIDFDSKKNHLMQLQYAAETLQPLPDTHIFVQRVRQLDELRTKAQQDIPALVTLVLESFGGKATQEQLQIALTPDVVSEADFKKWWDNAKKVLRKDGRFSVPSKKTDGVTLRDNSVSQADELILAFQQARRLKDQLGAIDQILKNNSSLAGNRSRLQAIVAQIEEIAAQNRRLHPGASFEFLIQLDDLCEQFLELKRSPESLTLPKLLQEHQNNLGEVLAEVSVNRQRRVMNEFVPAFPADWNSRLLLLIQGAPFRLAGEMARIFVEQNRTDELRQALTRWIRDHSVSSDILYWLCKERGAEHFGELLGADLLTSILAALERDQFTENRRGSKLHDLLMDDRNLVSDLVANITFHQARDIMRRVMLSPAFQDLNKRSLMARMIKVHPELQSMLSGESDEKEESIVVSWSSLQKRKEEYDDLITRKIPENTREIGVARSYGDLRENFEFKAAKEMQTVLMRRKAELEQMLARARGTSFENPDTTQVSIGTAVEVRVDSTDEIIRYTILGAWDSDPAAHIVSYQTAIGQALLGKRPGETVALPAEDGSRNVEILSIEPYQLDEEAELQTR